MCQISVWVVRLSSLLMQCLAAVSWKLWVTPEGYLTSLPCPFSFLQMVLMPQSTTLRYKYQMSRLPPSLTWVVKPVLISASLFQFPTLPQLALLFFICSFMSPDWQLKALLPCFWTVFLWVECRFWYPLPQTPPPPCFVLYRSCILSHYQTSSFFFLLFFYR